MVLQTIPELLCSPRSGHSWDRTTLFRSSAGRNDYACSVPMVPDPPFGRVPRGFLSVTGRLGSAPRPSVLETDVLLLILPAYFGERRYRTPPRMAGPSVFGTAIGLPGFTLHNGRRRSRPPWTEEVPQSDRDVANGRPASALSGPTVFQTAPRPRGSPSL